MEYFNQRHTELSSVLNDFVVWIEMCQNEGMSKKGKKTTYKVRNWSAYNQGLIERGSLTIWITPEVLAAWKDKRPAQRGGQFEYSELAIEALLTLKHLLRLPYRATQGFAVSLFSLMELTLEVPDYSTICRRAKCLKVDLPKSSQAARHIVIDSTGLKVYGEGEWQVRKHGHSKRRTWRKLHLAINVETQEIVAERLTSNSVDDATAGVEMLQCLAQPPEFVAADGAYDKRKFYAECQTQQIDKIVVPPQRNAKIWQHGNSSNPPHPRDENLRYIRRHGRKKWKSDSNYHQRSLAETAMFRFKTIFGSQLNARSDEQQQTEVAIKCAILNRFTALGLPDTLAISE